MWDFAIVGVDAATNTGADASVDDWLTRDASSGAQVVFLPTAGGADRAVALVNASEAAGYRADLIELTPSGAIADRAQRHALIAALELAVDPVLVSGLAGDELALGIELLAGAMRPRGLRRLLLSVTPELALRDDSPMMPVRIDSERDIYAVVAGIEELLSAGDLAGAKIALAALDELAREAHDPLAHPLPAALAALSLAVDCRRVPPPGADRLLLGARVKRADIGAAADALSDALLGDDGRDGAGALAVHAFVAAEQAADAARMSELTTMLTAWTGVSPAPPADFLTRLRSAVPAERRPLLDVDVAARLVAACRAQLASISDSATLGAMRRGLIAAATELSEVQVERIVRDELLTQVMVLGPTGQASVADASVLALAAVEVDPDDTETTRGALAAGVIPGDRVTVLGGARVAAAERVAVGACLALGARVQVLATSPHPDIVERVEVDAALAPVRHEAFCQCLAARIATAGGWPALTTVAKHVGDIASGETLSLAADFSAGLIGESQLRALDIAGVPDALLATIEQWRASPNRGVLAGWPDLRHRLRIGDPAAARELLAALPAPNAGKVSEAIVAAHRAIGDADLGDIARGLGVGEADELSPADQLAEIEAAVASSLEVDLDLLGIPDPAAMLFTSSCDTALRPERTSPTVVEVVLGSDAPLAVDVLAPGVIQPAIPDLDDELRALALAELRGESQPNGPWRIDAAVAAVTIAAQLELSSSSDAPIAKLASRRAGAALEYLIALPVLVRERGGRDFEEMVRAELEPLVTWFGDAPEADALRDWLESRPVDPRDIVASGRVGALRDLGGVQSLPVSAGVIAAGLVDAEERLVLESDPSYGTHRAAHLPLRTPVAFALARARTAWARAAGPDATTSDLLAERRARLILRALVRVPLPASAGTAGEPRLPPVAVRQFDRDTLRVRCDTELVADEQGVLRALVPDLDDTGLRVDLAEAGDLTARAVVARALVGPDDRWAATATELVELAPQFSDRASQIALLQAATVLVSQNPEQNVTLRAEIRAALERVSGELPAPVGLGTLGNDLLGAIQAARRSAADDLIRGVGDEFDNLDDATKAARLHKHAEREKELEHLDRLLL